MTLSKELHARVCALRCFENPQKIMLLGGGITNVNLTVTDNDQRYVVRLGEDIPEHGVMRWNELSIARAAAAADLSPALRYAAPGVMVIDYVEATALAEEDLHEEATLVAATQLVCRVHQDLPAHVRGPVLSFWVFHVLRDYAAFLTEKGSPHTAKLAGLIDEAATLERAVGKVDLVLGHNDLLPANILRAPDRLWLIDWEYGGFNSPLFDLGGLSTNAGLPVEAEQVMLETYFGAPPDETLWHSYGAMKCASLLRETMWSMVSEITSALEFDYAAYSEKNLSRYRQASEAYFRSRGLT